MDKYNYWALLIFLLLGCTQPTENSFEISTITSADSDTSISIPSDSTNLVLESKALVDGEWGLKIYANMLKAIGIVKKQAPTLRLGTEHTQPIFYEGNDNLIAPAICIRTSIYQFCQSMGKKKGTIALAFLLGHELVHFKEHKESFYNCLELNNKGNLEDEADMLGAFWAYYAGYEDIFKQQYIITNLIDSLYQDPKYRINSTSFHSSPKKRKKAIQRAMKESSDLAKIFKTGTYFLAIQEYQQALYSFEYLDAFINLKEIKTNLGLAQLILAESVAENKTYYPIDLAPNRLYESRDIDIDRDTLLAKAIQNLIQANKIYPQNNFSSLLNLCIAYLAKDQLSQVKFYLGKLKKQSFKKGKNNASKILILEGILAKKEGNLDLSQKFFNRALSLNNDSYIQNLIHFNTIEVTSKNPSKTEKIIFNDLNLNKALIYPNYPSKNSQERKLFAASTYFKQFSTSLFWKQSLEKEDKQQIVALHIAQDKQFKTQKGIKKGSSIKDLMQLYGSPTQQLHQGSKIYLYYDSAKLVFLLDKGIIQEWATYTTAIIEH